jgi:hypothetical protein
LKSENTKLEDMILKPKPNNKTQLVAYRFLSILSVFVSALVLAT